MLLDPLSNTAVDHYELSSLSPIHRDGVWSVWETERKLRSLHTHTHTHTHTLLWSVLYECRVFEREREMGSELESLKMKIYCSAYVCVFQADKVDG